MEVRPLFNYDREEIVKLEEYLRTMTNFIQGVDATLRILPPRYPKPERIAGEYIADDDLERLQERVKTHNNLLTKLEEVRKCVTDVISNI